MKNFEDYTISELRARIEELKSPDKTYDGLTVAQWRQVIKLGTLCEFWDGPGQKRYEGTLETAYMGGHGYLDNNRNHWKHARISTKPGHIRPHFGGPCPIDPIDLDTNVIIKHRGGRWSMGLPDDVYDWGGSTSSGSPEDVVAFIELPLEGGRNETALSG